ncbi:hypothetical protein [Umezawaea sp. Da 62-37]|nr:hypothetical protein [Umezawaea sp. Da 62-37]WNV85616.1 hypothetical protein RM788_47120 [Umezawaea sp. Da 62-37]
MTFVDGHTVAGLAGEHGVPAAVAQELTGLLRPGVVLVKHGDSSTTACSR